MSITSRFIPRRESDFAAFTAAPATTSLTLQPPTPPDGILGPGHMVQPGRTVSSVGAARLGSAVVGVAAIAGAVTRNNGATAAGLGAVPSGGAMAGIDTALGAGAVSSATEMPPVAGGTQQELWPEFGSLAPIIAHPGVTDVLVNGSHGVWVDEGSGLMRAPLRFDDDGVRALATRLIALGGRHVDEVTPAADVRLRDGVRVHVMLPPLSVDGPLVSIRVPRSEPFSLEELVVSGSVTAKHADLFQAAVAGKHSFLISGATGTGKTSVLASLLALTPGTERIVTVEDVAELRVRHPHVVSLESRQANLEGAGAVGLERLVREALRMRPDRLVVGEVRGVEVRDLLTALNTGHAGAGTVHANSLRDVPARLESLGALAGFDPAQLARQVVSAIDLVIHLGRDAGRRYVAGVGEFRLDKEGHLQLCSIT